MFDVRWRQWVNKVLCVVTVMYGRRRQWRASWVVLYAASRTTCSLASRWPWSVQPALCLCSRPSYSSSASKQLTYHHLPVALSHSASDFQPIYPIGSHSSGNILVRESSWHSSLKRLNCWRKNCKIWFVITENSGRDCIFTWKSEP